MTNFLVRDVSDRVQYGPPFDKSRFVLPYGDTVIAYTTLMRAESLRRAMTIFFNAKCL